MAKKKASRTIVGSPLTPSLLGELDALGELPSTPRDFKPDGNWVNKYRIWTCHGYRESGNENVGFVRIERVSDSDKVFTLKVRQHVTQTDGIVNVVDAIIECRKNRLASPTKWQVSSRFMEADGQDVPKLASKQNGGSAVGADRVTCDWGLFEAVQRLAFHEQSSLSFDLLEGLSLSKLRHNLSYRGVYSEKIPGSRILHCFVQLGSGILPAEYWLDEDHRLLLVCSMNKAYILDDQAPEVIQSKT
ncbi:MAG: hypothetical protein JSU70_20690 [Phycisphaerales bacterium]|nr:MAG: hypothetical protein JSU70_20690 [Phycisphaerales bacterium]